MLNNSLPVEIEIPGEGVIDRDRLALASDDGA